MRYILMLIALLASVTATSAPAAATDYVACDPLATVCVIQDDGEPGDPECDDGYLSWYGANRAENAVRVNAPGAQAYAGVYEACGHWHIHDSYSYGARADVKTDDATFTAHWIEGWRVANPDCNWNAEHRSDVTRLGAYGDGPAGRAGILWHDGTTTSCDGTESTYECQTLVYTMGVADQDLGCPAGDPVSPPSPAQIPYGRLLP